MWSSIAQDSLWHSMTMFGVPLSHNCICMCFFFTCRYTGASQDPITLCIYHLDSSTCNLHIGKCTRIGWCKDAHTVFQSSITSSLAQMVTSLPNTITSSLTNTITSSLPHHLGRHSWRSRDGPVPPQPSSWYRGPWSEASPEHLWPEGWPPRRIWRSPYEGGKALTRCTF